MVKTFKENVEEYEFKLKEEGVLQFIDVLINENFFSRLGFCFQVLFFPGRVQEVIDKEMKEK